jgi:DNA primase
MGTALTDRVLLMVEAHKLPVSVWLDSDAPGRRASAKIVRKLLNYGIEARAIHTELDPKCYSNEEIAKFLLT